MTAMATAWKQLGGGGVVGGNRKQAEGWALGYLGGGCSRQEVKGTVPVLVGP